MAWLAAQGTSLLHEGLVAASGNGHCRRCSLLAHDARMLAVCVVTSGGSGDAYIRHQRPAIEVGLLWHGKDGHLRRGCAPCGLEVLVKALPVL